MKKMDGKSKQNIMAIGALLIVVVLVISGVFVYYEFYHKTETRAEESTSQSIDNRVSPLVSQGLNVEILRIRNRGLMDKMLKIGGTNWKNPPSFYWKVIVDGNEDNSLGSIGLGSNGLYHMWDSMGLESKSHFKIKDEQLTSDATIIIYEREKTGFFGRKTTDVERQQITLVYDYRTGHWSGDDTLKDSDGYGHVRGETYDVWFNLYQDCYSHDYIPYWMKVDVYHIDPAVDCSTYDPNHDGIPITWDWKWGYDPFAYDNHSQWDPDCDGLTNLQEYQVAKWFADPFQPDIYIEADGMQKKGLIDVQHVFFKEAQQMLIERFAQHGINVYIDDGWPDGPKNGGGEMVPFVKIILDPPGGQELSYYLHNFADERKGIFRYLLIANQAGWTMPSKFNYYDTIVVGNSLKNDIKLKYAYTKRQMIVTLADGVMHELGHELGLKPEEFKGADISPTTVRYPSMPKDEYNNYLTKYYSIMNYYYIYGGLVGGPQVRKARTLFDYSHGSNGAPYDQNDWEHLYLPGFKIDATVIEQGSDKSFEDQMAVLKSVNITSKDWAYKGNLTQQYNKTNSNLRYFDSIGFDFKVFEYNGPDSNQSGNIRVYARPQVHLSNTAWSFIAQGKVDSSNNIKFYSQQDQINYVLNQISEKREK
jgi:hypothetical protein